MSDESVSKLDDHKALYAVTADAEEKMKGEQDKVQKVEAEEGKPCYTPPSDHRPIFRTAPPWSSPGLHKVWAEKLRTTLQEAGKEAKNANKEGLTKEQTKLELSLKDLLDKVVGDSNSKKKAKHRLNNLKILEKIADESKIDLVDTSNLVKTTQTTHGSKIINKRHKMIANIVVEPSWPSPASRLRT